MKIELKATPDNAFHFTRFLTAAGIKHEVKLIEANEIAIALVLNEVDFKTVKVKPQQTTIKDAMGIPLKDKDLACIWSLLIEELLNEDLLKNVMNIRI